MKNYFLKFLLFVAVTYSFTTTVNAQFVVRIRPAAPVFVRPLAPSPRHIWIGDEWVWRNGRYNYNNGNWAIPPRGGIWISGHWKNTRRGWVWRAGHWR